MTRAKQTLRSVWPLVAFGAVTLLLLSFAQAFAQAPAGGFSGLGGANAKKPVEIEYDRLEVDDKRHLAIFIGSVSATQGDYNLKAPRLEVTYERGSRASQADNSARASKQVNPVKAPAENTGNDPMSSGQIKIIHALGGTVVLTNKKDQQEATGEDAIYNVKAQKVTMTGKKVILTQKQNVVEGKRLEINLTTGLYNLIPYDEPAKGGKPAQKPGRVRAILHQEGGKGGISINPFGEAKKKDEPATKPDSPPQKSAPSQQSPSSSGWQTQGR
jgi:lipopolysaccharide export system protein LptA